MLDRLEGADGPAELLAHLCVLDRHLQSRPADADGLCGRQNPKHRARLARGATQYPVLCDRDAAQCDRSDAASGVHRLQRGDGDPFGVSVDDHHILTCGDHQDRGIGRPKHRGALARDDEIGADAHIARQRKCADGGPIGQPGKDLRAKRIRCAPIDHQRRRHARQEGAGAQFAALRLQHDRQFGEAETRTAVLLGDGKTGPPLIRRRRPDVGGMSGTLVECRACGRAAVQPAQLADGGLGQVVVFLGDG